MRMRLYPQLFLPLLPLVAITACLPASQKVFAQAAPPSPLPVRQVTLFTSGVSYVERGGEVEGNATVPLTFRTAQINDILKSMVLLDERGKVQPATYAARDPIGRTLQAFSIDVTQNMSLPEILAQVRGAKVAIDVGEKSITGQIIGVETRVVAVQDNKPFVTHVLNLLTESGITWVRLDSANYIRLLDERLNREFREALGLLATGTDDQRRTVTLHFSGDGRRQVRVGYVTESPLWKMSYRLLLGGKKAGQPAAKPYMQGWALVENTSDEDWNGIRLSLVSGRPISFIQDLYQPLYLPRPVVPVDVVASPYPQTHGGNLDEAQRRVAAYDVDNSAIPGVATDGETRDRKSGLAMGRGGGGRGGAMGLTGPRGDAGAAGPAAGNQPKVYGGAGGGFGGMTADAARASLEAQASGQNAGEQFEYNIKTSVNLPRQQAAMIPVVSQDIETEKVVIYNADTGSKFPLNAVRIKNTTGLHLKGGPITLFDEGVYAGDAKMEDIPPGDSRLVSYAVDLTIEGERQGPNGSQTETSLSLKHGVLIVTRRERQEIKYTLKSKAERPKTVLIEQPFNSEFTLVAPAKATERTANLYRFAVTVPPGKSEKLTVVTERPISQSIAIFDADLNTLAYYANRKDISQKLRDTLQQVVQRRRAALELQAQAAAKDAEIAAMGTDQDRIRKNMAALDKMSALYKRYVTDLDRQETRLQTLRQEAATLRKQAFDAERELRTYVDSLTITD